jgi:hypothetical protein
MEEKVIKLTELEWSKVEQLQYQAFHGIELSKEEMELCKKALREDAERYKRNGSDLRENYRKSLCF